MPDTSFNQSEQVLPCLRLHQRRRDEGLPTISVMVGSHDIAAALWRHWASEAGYCPVVRPRDDVPMLAVTLVERIRSSCDLPRLAINALLYRSGRPATVSTSPMAPPLDGRSLADVDALAESVLWEPDPTGTAAVAHEICRLTVLGKLQSPDLAEKLDARLADRPEAPQWRVLRALDELLPTGACPAVLLTGPTSQGSGVVPSPPAIASVGAVAHSLAQFVATIPTWPVAVALSSKEFNSFKGAAADSQTKSLLTTGAIVLPRMSRSLHNARSHPARKPSDAPSGSMLLAAELARAQVLAHAAADAARSNAEQLLFEMLESNPTTKGHFVLNGSPGFKFGPRQAEVDLLASGLRLAVEIDGYYHFTNPDSYRRDRRKDWALQRHGYTVVRVLAEDVSAQMEKVLDFLVTVVENCRASVV